jgi:hypothetical protein
LLVSLKKGFLLFSGRLFALLTNYCENSSTQKNMELQEAGTVESFQEEMGFGERPLEV